MICGIGMSRMGGLRGKSANHSGLVNSPRRIAVTQMEGEDVEDLQDDLVHWWRYQRERSVAPRR